MHVRVDLTSAEYTRDRKSHDNSPGIYLIVTFEAREHAPTAFASVPLV